MRADNQEYTYLSEKVLAGSGIGNSPEVIAGILDIQRRASDQTADVGDVQQAADNAQASADTAQTSADNAATQAGTAQSRADDAYTLASSKVTKTTIASPANYTSTASATYTQAEVQALMDKVGALTGTIQAIVAALKV